MSSRFRDNSELHDITDHDRLVRLRELFPGWTVWRGLTERHTLSGWYASRRRHISDDQVDEGLRRRLDADTWHDLLDRLAAQEELELRLWTESL